jgi:hypothetical protein
MTLGKRRLLTWFGLAACATLGFIFGSRQESNHSAGHAGTVSPSHKEHEAKQAPHYQAESTRRMAILLKKLGKNFAPDMLVLRQDPTLARYARNINQPSDIRGRSILEAGQGYNQLLLGNSKEAVRLLSHVKEAILANNLLFDQQFFAVVRGYLAISYLRLGEQQNCIDHRDLDSCLLPIRGSGVHTLQTATRSAIQEYTAILNDNPKDLTARWLLNLSYMSVGEYPGGVPKNWLLPPEIFKSEYEIKRFYDLSSQMGLKVSGLAGGVVLEDFDRDGYIDIMVSSSGLDEVRDQLRYFHNNGNGTVSDYTERAGLTGLIGGSNLVQADFDNDGFPDVLVLRGGGLIGTLAQQPPSLLRNNGDGTFDDVTELAGLLSFHPAQTASWADYDNDGLLDLFIGVQSSAVPYFEVPLYQAFPRPREQPCKLYHNNGDGTFAEVSSEAGLELVGYVQGAVWGDYNNDGLPDLFVSRKYGPGLLYRNNGKDSAGKTTFTKVAEMEPSNGFVTWFWDYDNDGWQDIFVSGYSQTGIAYSAGQVAAGYLGLPVTAELPRLYRNNHDGSFTDVTKQAKLNKVVYAMSGNFGDLDNDGWLDFYLGTGGPDYRALIPNRMFRNAEGLVFQDVTTAGGFGHLQKGAAIAFGDMNNDGAQDIYAVMGGELPGDGFQRALFMNPGSTNHWITLRLAGVESNRSAIGTRIKVSVDAKGKSRDIFATVSSGGSYGASTLQQEIGLGRATSIRSLELLWPRSGKKQIFKNLKMNQIVTIREGDPKLHPTVSRNSIDRPR